MWDAVPEEIKKQLTQENGSRKDIGNRSYVVKKTDDGSFIVYNNEFKPKPAGGGFPKKEWRPLVFAFHLQALPDVKLSKDLIERFKKDNPKCLLTRYEVKEDGKGYYIFEEKASLGSS